MGWHMQTGCLVVALTFYCIFMVSEAREIPTGAAGPLRGSAVASAGAHGVTDTEIDDDSPRAGAKRELGEISFHHGGHGGGGGGGGHGHGHATSYQNFVLHSYHPKKVIYHKKGHGHHHHSPPPGVPVVPHHVPVPVAAAAVPAYDEGVADDGSYSLY